MRKIEQTAIRFNAEDGDELRVVYDNRGDPYREGITMSLDKASGQYGIHVFLDEDEARKLRDLLNGLYPAVRVSAA